MKKIISALTVSALVAGAAFADVSVTCNYRQRAALLSHVNKSDNALRYDTKKTTYDGFVAVDEASKTLYTDAYSGSGTDNLAIKLEGDIASFEVTLVGDEATTSKIRAKTLGSNLKLGKVQLFAGFWADGKVKGAYRNKTDVDAGNIEGMDFEYKKLGSAYAGSPSFFVDNLVMPVQVTASESYAVGGVYNFNTKAVKLNFNLAYITNETSDEKGSKSGGSLQGHTVAGLVEARTGFGTGEFVFKYGQVANLDTAMAFGAYLQPVLVDNLTVTIGGAGSVIDGTFTDWSADLRLYYKLGNISFTSFHNCSAIIDAEENAAKLNGKSNSTTKGIADTASYDSSKGTAAAFGFGKHGGTPITADLILSNNLMIRYKVNNTFSVFGIFADMISGNKNLGQDMDGDFIQLRASGWAQFYAGSSSICLGVVWESFDHNGLSDFDALTSIAIPMIFRVKM